MEVEPIELMTISTPPRLFDSTSNWDSLYCSHLWLNSQLRNGIIGAPLMNNTIKYCYTCKGKIRKYEIRPLPDVTFQPHNHSTPNRISISNNKEAEEAVRNTAPCALTYKNDLKVENQSLDAVHQSNNYIPSISQQIDAGVSQKYSSIVEPLNNRNHKSRRLRKSLKSIGCVISLGLTEKFRKKQCRLQACSISLMIIAIVVITFVLINFTNSNQLNSSNVNTTFVPTDNKYLFNTAPPLAMDVITVYPSNTETFVSHYVTTTAATGFNTSTTATSELSEILAKIRKNIKTYRKDEKKDQILNDESRPKEINNRDLSLRFCSCQSEEVCMLDETSGTAICKAAKDLEDPTGCGGLCALETEACQLVDRARGVRVCRLLATISCTADEWRCRNGLCVPASARCDGIVHCYDKTDEMHCDCNLSKHFRCGHSISCFPNVKLCDGVIDCWDGFDEINCTAECPQGEFTCTNGACIKSVRFCDGLADCTDGSDEPQGCSGACSKHEMRCSNGRCVPMTQTCDGIDQCGDSTDEKGCSV